MLIGKSLTFIRFLALVLASSCCLLQLSFSAVAQTSLPDEATNRSRLDNLLLETAPLLQHVQESVFGVYPCRDVNLQECKKIREAILFPQGQPNQPAWAGGMNAMGTATLIHVPQIYVPPTTEEEDVDDVNNNPEAQPIYFLTAAHVTHGTGQPPSCDTELHHQGESREVILKRPIRFQLGQGESVREEELLILAKTTSHIFGSCLPMIEGQSLDIALLQVQAGIIHSKNGRDRQVRRVTHSELLELLRWSNTSYPNLILAPNPGLENEAASLDHRVGRRQAYFVGFPNGNKQERSIPGMQKWITPRVHTFQMEPIWLAQSDQTAEFGQVDIGSFSRARLDSSYLSDSSAGLSGSSLLIYRIGRLNIFGVFRGGDDRAEAYAAAKECNGQFISRCNITFSFLNRNWTWQLFGDSAASEHVRHLVSQIRGDIPSTSGLFIEIEALSDLELIWLIREFAFGIDGSANGSGDRYGFRLWLTRFAHLFLKLPVIMNGDIGSSFRDSDDGYDECGRKNLSDSESITPCVQQYVCEALSSVSPTDQPQIPAERKIRGVATILRERGFPIVSGALNNCTWAKPKPWENARH